MYLVIGATGNIGGQLVTQLVEQGHEVRGLVRDPSRTKGLPAGVDIAVGDLDDAASLAAAARGAEAAFFMQVAPDPRQATSMVEAAKAGGVRRIVLLLSIGTRVRPMPMIGAGIATRDDVIHRSGLPVTTLRPNTLMSNALWWLQSIRDEGRLYDATDPGRTSPVDPADIARVAAIALADERHAGHGFLLNGPEALTAREQVETLADVLGRPIEFVSVEPAEFARRMVEHGTPPELAAAVQNLNEMFRTGRAGVLSDNVENLTGTAPRSFRGWCEEHADAFR